MIVFTLFSRKEIWFRKKEKNFEKKFSISVKRKAVITVLPNWEKKFLLKKNH